jgi:hypothetical protein
MEVINMKSVSKLTLFCMVLMTVSLIFTNISHAKIDPKNLLGMWLFDEKNNTGKDSSGNGFDGVPAGAVKQVKGKFGDAIDVSGGASIVIADNDKLNFADKKSFTVVVWINFSVAQDWNRIVRERNPGPWGGGNLGWELQTQTTQIHWSLDDKAGGNLKNTFDNVGNGSWHHTAMVVDREKKMLYSYLDGANEKSVNIAIIGAITDAQPITIGGGFNGIIDEIGIFSGVLTIDDINLIMTKGLSEAVLKGASVNIAGKLATTWGKTRL